MAEQGYPYFSRLNELESNATIFEAETRNSNSSFHGFI